MTWMKSLSNKTNPDYFWNFNNYLDPVLYSGMTKERYDLVSDIDEMDYKEFKKGYVLIERLL